LLREGWAIRLDRDDLLSSKKHVFPEAEAETHTPKDCSCCPTIDEARGLVLHHAFSGSLPTLSRIQNDCQHA